jgi:NAD(P)-binding Rossmann-like domain
MTGSIAAFIQHTAAGFAPAALPGQQVDDAWNGRHSWPSQDGRSAMPDPRASESIGGRGVQHFDIAVVGAGFAGLYLLHRLRQAGFTAQGLEAADDVGGTWYWNRYPGARCDIQTTDYSFTFDPELEAAWQWSEKYATQPEILRYLGFVADRYDLRRDIRFATRVTSARWNEATQRWLLATSAGPSVSCRCYIMASGCLSEPKPPRSTASRTSRATFTSPGAGRTPGSTSPASGLPSSAPARRASRRSH